MVKPLSSLLMAIKKSGTLQLIKHVLVQKFFCLKILWIPSWGMKHGLATYFWKAGQWISRQHTRDFHPIGHGSNYGEREKDPSHPHHHSRTQLTTMTMKIFILYFL